MISLIIPTKDRATILEQTVKQAKEAISSFEGEIIVVNDSDQELILPNELKVGLTIVRNPKQGVASGRNYGASKAKGEWLLFLDDDMLIEPSNIEEALVLAKDRPRACININWEYPDKLKNNLGKRQFGRFLNYYGFTSFKGWNKNSIWIDDTVFEPNAITSQFLLIRRDIFLSIGGYNESFPFAGFEDYDFTQRLKQNKLKIYVQPNTKAYHNEADRSNIDQWLARRKRGGETRRVAVNLGYKELTLHYGNLKSIVYDVVLSRKLFFSKTLEWIPNKKIFDWLYFFVVNLLYGAYVYEGYNEKL